MDKMSSQLVSKQKIADHYAQKLEASKKVSFPGIITNIICFMNL